MLKKVKYAGQKILFWRNVKRTNKEVFSRIYAKHLWDEGNRNKKDLFYSGKGSDDIYGNAYANIILKFMDENGMGGGWESSGLGMWGFQGCLKVCL